MADTLTMIDTNQKTISNGIPVYSTVWCPDCKRARKFFGKQRIPYTNIDIDRVRRRRKGHCGDHES